MCVFYTGSVIREKSAAMAMMTNGAGGHHLTTKWPAWLKQRELYECTRENEEKKRPAIREKKKKKLTNIQQHNM